VLLVLDDNELALGDDKGFIEIYNSRSKLLSIKAHSDKVNCLEKLPFKRIASGSTGNLIKIWNISRDSTIFSNKNRVFVSSLVGHSNSILKLLATDSNLISVSKDSSIKVWDITTYQCEKTMKGHNCAVDSIKLIRMLRLNKVTSVSTCNENVLNIWEFTSGETSKLKGHLGRVTVTIQLTNNKIATGSEDSTVRIWSCHSFSCLRILTGHNSAILSLFESKDGKVVSGSSDNSVYIWQEDSSYAMIPLQGASIRMLHQRDSALLSITEEGVSKWNLETRSLRGSTPYRSNPVQNPHKDLHAAIIEEKDCTYAIVSTNKQVNVIRID